MPQRTVRSLPAQNSRVARIALVALAASCGCHAARADTTVLYRAAPGTTPATQGWLAATFIGPRADSDDAGTRVSQAAGNEGGYGGYSNHSSSFTIFPPQVNTGPLVNPAFPTLDRNAGYSLQLDFSMSRESHTGNADRAGFTLLLIGHDKMGIEIGFQSDRIFAYGTTPSMFSAGESTSDAGALSGLGSTHSWTLAVQGNGYSLAMGDGAVLSGLLRDYSGYAGLGQDAYRTPDFLFFGDNSSSAQADFSFSYAAVSTVPEPAPTAFLAVGALLLYAARRSRSATA